MLEPMSTHVPAPSNRLWAAALAGLIGLGSTACSDKTPVQPDPVDASAVDSTPVDAPGPDAPPDAPPSKVISETEGNRTFADIKAECDTRHGYVQITAACAGMNSCAGFSYGDWDPGVTTEHSCAGVNGCNGISCVVLPVDGGRTALQVLGGEGVTFDQYGAQTCMNCHADWSGAQPDPSKFNVWVMEGSGRNATNWLDNSAEAQARTIAFGKHGLLADGTAYSPMAGYWKVYSRAEIERVVDYIRTTPATNITIKTIKTTDPVIPLRAFVGGHRRRQP
ncbi:MAG: hypothetical protein NT062_27625 [Proteobacteria bacterium]|nr:hypothetical protein [Pseudomonadota bacterium]